MTPLPMAMNSLSIEAARHLKFVAIDNSSVTASRTHLDEELSTAPLFSSLARRLVESQYNAANGNTQNYTSRLIYPQYGLLGLRIHPAASSFEVIDDRQLVYANVAAPWSAFICGSQGSGKSHTLSCLLENALISASPAGRLSSPLAAMVLHYDKFTAFASTQLCEAAYLCSSGIPVRVLVSPTNYRVMKEAYEKLSNKVEVVPMYLSERHLNVTTMKKLMGIGTGGDQPLYMEVVIKILRDMVRQTQGQQFNYWAFKQKLEEEKFIGSQNLPLKMRLEVLESFFEPPTTTGKGQARKYAGTSNDLWTFKKGTLTIVDLSCPFIGPDDACALFNICVSLFLEGRAGGGRVIALDEAHKYLSTTSGESEEFTETLLSIVRQQRHLGTRVVVATQEPTVSPALLDLCNVTIVHRFNSPAWFKAIEGHIAGAAMLENKKSHGESLFRRIVRLATGEALVFCPTALLDVVSSEEDEDPDDAEEAGGVEVDSSRQTVDGQGQRVVQLGASHIHVKIRKRITTDGGRSFLA